MLEEERMLGNDTVDKTCVRKPRGQVRSPMHVQYFPDTSTATLPRCTKFVCTIPTDVPQVRCTLWCQSLSS
jgi:hypothetical protein